MLEKLRRKPPEKTLEQRFAETNNEPFKIFPLREELKHNENVSDYFGVAMARYRDYHALLEEQRYQDMAATITLQDMVIDLFNHAADTSEEKKRLFNKFVPNGDPSILDHGPSFDLTPFDAEISGGLELPKPFTLIAARYRSFASRHDKGELSPVVQTVTEMAADLFAHDTQLYDYEALAQKYDVSDVLPDIHIPDAKKVQLKLLEEAYIHVAEDRRKEKPVKIKLPTGEKQFMVTSSLYADLAEAFLLAEKV